MRWLHVDVVFLCACLCQQATQFNHMPGQGVPVPRNRTPLATSGTAPKICGMRSASPSSRKMFHFESPPITGE
jgi:hypothetical protein